MKDKPPKTLAEYQLDAIGNGLKCPKCHCQNFEVYKTQQGQSATVRYKKCRNCGTKLLTSTHSAERIIREVDVRDDDDESPIVMFGT